MTGKELVNHVMSTTGMDISEVLQVCKEAQAYCEGFLDRLGANQ